MIHHIINGWTNKPADERAWCGARGADEMARTEAPDIIGQESIDYPEHPIYGNTAICVACARDPRARRFR